MALTHNKHAAHNVSEVIHELEEKAHDIVVGAYSLAEEIANCVTHGIGAVLSITALVLMVTLAITQSTIAVVASSIYGASLVLLFLASALYHGIPQPKAKAWLMVFDHCAIYLLIAGTYTPFLLISLEGAWGYTLMAIIWSFALFGIMFKVFFKHRFPKLSLFTYIAMGWLIIVASTEMVANVATGGLILLAAGGLTYTLGTVFYVYEKVPYNHAIWHLFVLGGAIFHFFAVYLFVIPSA